MHDGMSLRCESQQINLLLPLSDQPATSGWCIRFGIRQSMPSSEGLQEYPLW
jgi:hypothetical protein